MNEDIKIMLGQVHVLVEKYKDCMSAIRATPNNRIGHLMREDLESDLSTFKSEIHDTIDHYLKGA